MISSKPAAARGSRHGETKPPPHFRARDAARSAQNTRLAFLLFLFGKTSRFYLKKSEIKCFNKRSLPQLGKQNQPDRHFPDGNPKTEHIIRRGGMSSDAPPHHVVSAGKSAGRARAASASRRTILI